MHRRVRSSLSIVLACIGAGYAAASDYVVVVGQSTFEDAAWKIVVDTLVTKHDATVLTYRRKPSDALPRLRNQHPRHTCFVVKPTEATREFVTGVHQLTREYDEDVYTDTFWGILTGFNGHNALTIAKCAKPLIVRKVASGTEIALDMCQEGLWYDELVRNKLVRKQRGSVPEEIKGPDDTTATLVDTLNSYLPDLFVTSGHATERDWMIGFRYKNGRFVSKAGQLVGVDTAGNRHEVDSSNPKVYMPIGNCLMGHIDGLDAMALAWMNDAGVRQMIGYTVPTWFGYAGWGCLDYFVEQPGRYTFNEAFLANHHALVHLLNTTETESRGLTFDRDVVAFYGDPKWEARMADAPLAYDQELTETNGVYSFVIKPNRGVKSFEPINTNGSQRGWRPIVQFLGHRIKGVQVLEGEDLRPTITDDFLLVPNPRVCDPKRTYRIVFSAARVE